MDFDKIRLNVDTEISYILLKNINALDELRDLLTIIYGLFKYGFISFSEYFDLKTQISDAIEICVENNKLPF